MGTGERPEGYSPTFEGDNGPEYTAALRAEVDHLHAELAIALHDAGEAIPALRRAAEDALAGAMSQAAAIVDAAKQDAARIVGDAEARAELVADPVQAAPARSSGRRPPHRARRVAVAALGIAAIVAVVTASILRSAGTSTSTDSVTPCPHADGSSPRVTRFSRPPPSCIDPARHWTATLRTTEGDMAVALDTTLTAGTANNFVVLSLYHYFDGTPLSGADRSVDAVLGGSRAAPPKVDPGPGYTINDEGGTFIDTNGALSGPFATYVPGDLVMARTGQSNSAAARFFLVAGARGGALADGGGPYVRFGHISTGLDVLLRIYSSIGASCDLRAGTCRTGAGAPVVVKSVVITMT